MFGTLLMTLVAALYVLFAFREPPAAIAHFFPIPVVTVFFRPEHRVKYGRLAIGALLLLLGPLCDLFPGDGRGGPSVLRLLLGLVVLGVWLVARWKRAGEVVEADDEERRAQWQSFEMLKRDPRLVHLQQSLHAKGYRTAFEPAADPTAYRVAYAVLWDAQWRPLLAQQGAAAAHLGVYLEREAAPKRVHACLDLQTGVCGEKEAGLTGWGGMVPLPPRAS